MSLYNQLFGANIYAPALLCLIDLEPTQIPRFRDCYLNDEGEIVVLTRTGGPNRADYDGGNAGLQLHPDYVRDYDDEFDSTYAYFVFRARPEYREALHVIGIKQGPFHPMQRFRKMLADFEAGVQTPDTERAKQVGEAIVTQMQQQMQMAQDSGDTGKIGIIEV